MNRETVNRNREKNDYDRLGAISFALDDLRLYLDTHPDDEDALRLYGDYTEERNKLLAERKDFSGSVNAYEPNLANGWDWNAGPMPWKGAD